MPAVLRPMSLGELLDKTFRLYRNHFLLFIGIAALPNLGVLAVATISSGITQSHLLAKAGVTGIVLSVIGVLVWIVIYLVAIAASHAATVVAVSSLHLEHPITITEAYARVKKQVLKLTGVVLGVTLGIGLGFILLIIPGIILALKWALAIPVAVVEDAGLSVATSRSSDLTQGSKGRIFVVAFVVLVMVYLVSVLVEIPVVVLAGSYVKSGVMPLWLTGVSNVLGTIGNTLVAPMLTIALSLIYYDERVRKEGFDLQVLMGNLSASEAAAAGQM